MHALTLLLLVPPTTFAAGPASPHAESADSADSADSAETLGGTQEPGLIPDREESAPIINGGAAEVDDFPMTGGVLLDADFVVPEGQAHLRVLLCSSTLIAPDVVLLAAHCLDPFVLTQGMGSLENSDFRWTRRTNLTAFDGQGETAPWPDDAVRASDWVFHPDWDIRTAGMGLAENSDIGLLFLSEPVLDVPFAWLPTRVESIQIVEGLLVDVVGWGQQEASDAREPPARGTYGKKQMGQSFLNKVNTFEMQVGAVVSDVRKCHGDSGGPTFLSIATTTRDSMRVVGVTSHAYDESDCERKGGVDTRVDHYLDWIDNELRIRCADGSRAWCEEEGIPDPALVGVDPDEEEEKGGCACDVGGSGALGGLLLPGLVVAGVVGRRRRLVGGR